MTETLGAILGLAIVIPIIGILRAALFGYIRFIFFKQKGK